MQLVLLISRGWMDELGPQGSPSETKCVSSQDLSDLLFQEGAKRAIVIKGVNVEIPTELGIPLGFIINELITNSVKYAKGNITVRLGTAADVHSLSVSDDGPGVPAEFDPTGGSGLGMKIIKSLAK